MNNLKGKIVIRENSSFTRIGDKGELTLKKSKSIYHKRVIRGVDRIVKMYNSKDELVCVDIEIVKDEIRESYQNKRRTRVILRDLDGNAYWGTSICHEEDIFDHQTGYGIALHRAIIKRSEAIVNKLCEE